MDYKNCEDHDSYMIFTLWNDRKVRMDVVKNSFGRKWLNPEGVFLDDGSTTFACISWDDYKKMNWTKQIRPEQILIAFSKYIHHYRPGDEGWSKEDQEVYDMATGGQHV